MSVNVEKFNSRIIPEHHKEAFLADLGNIPDTKVAAKWTKILRADPSSEVPADFEMSRQFVASVRSRLGIQAANPRKYFKPITRGGRRKIEDEFPEIVDYIGKVPASVIMKKFGVSRAALIACARRNGRNTIRVTDVDSVLEYLGGGQ